MIDERELLQRAAERFTPPEDAFERFSGRSRKHRRNQRIVSGVVAVAVAAIVAGALAVALRAHQQTMPATPPDLFTRVQGWIAVGSQNGIEAIDPNEPKRSILLSHVMGNPIAWSKDGQELLIGGLYSRVGPAVVLGDGSVVPLHLKSGAQPGSFSEDGSEVLYSLDGGLYAMNIETGASRTIVEGGAGAHPRLGGPPRLSPDGSVIAVDEGDGKGPIWLVNADGSDPHQLIDEATIASIYKTSQDSFQDWLMGSWSPDSSELTVSVDGHDFFIVGAVSRDGSGIRRVTPVDGRSLNATWSPDWSQIAATNETTELQIMDADGSNVRTVHIATGEGSPFLFAAWNPVASPTATTPPD